MIDAIRDKIGLIIKGSDDSAHKSYGELLTLDPELMKKWIEKTFKITAMKPPNVSASEQTDEKNSQAVAEWFSAVDAKLEEIPGKLEAEMNKTFPIFMTMVATKDLKYWEHNKLGGLGMEGYIERKTSPMNITKGKEFKLLQPETLDKGRGNGARFHGAEVFGLGGSLKVYVKLSKTTSGGDMARQPFSSIQKDEFRKHIVPAFFTFGEYTTVDKAELYKLTPDGKFLPIESKEHISKGETVTVTEIKKIDAQDYYDKYFLCVRDGQQWVKLFKKKGGVILEKNHTTMEGGGYKRRTKRRTKKRTKRRTKRRKTRTKRRNR